jgi:hypothetical protein
MLRNSLILSKILLRHEVAVLSVRTYVPKRSREPGINRRLKDFGEDFKRNLDDPEYVVR